jgi:hypothetical protein
VTLGLAELLGLPPADLTYHVSWFRYALLVVAVAWAALAARGRWAGLVGGLLFVEATLAFWTLALPRPYGLFADDVATRRLAALSVAAATGTRESGPLAGEPLAGGDRVFAGLASLDGLALTTLLPFLAVALLALAVHVFGDPARSGVPAVLWLAFSTGEVDALRGLGLLPGLFAHPVGSLALVAIVAAVLAVTRLRLPPQVTTVAGALTVSAWAFVPRDPAPVVAAWDLAWILTLDQGPWLVLGAWGLFRGAGPGAVALTGGGALLLAASAFGEPVDPWGAHAVYRTGLLLAAAGPVEDLAERLGDAARGRRWPRLLAGGAPALRQGLALLVLALVPVSFPARWNPRRLDPVYEASLEPVAAPLRAEMAWIRAHTEPEATVLAGPLRAPAVAALGGRRVLRGAALGVAVDDERRRRLERAVIEGRDVAALRQRYGLRYVVAAPGDFREHGLERPEDLAARGLRLVREGAGGVRIYVLE